MTRAYTVAEIDALRCACEQRWLFGTTLPVNRASRSYREPEKTASVEELVRTYMLAGITAADIYEEDRRCTPQETPMDYDTLRAAYPEWQPIDTAPRDGTVVLVYAHQGPHWNGIHPACPHYSKRTGAYGHDWAHASYQNLGDHVSGRVTHWMPLPPSPQENPDGL